MNIMHNIIHASIAQWLVHLFHKQKVASSNLAVCSIASVAEWSKATDSSSVLFGGVGSNPTGCNHYYYYFF